MFRRFFGLDRFGVVASQVRTNAPRRNLSDARRRRARAQLSVEALEARDLPSATLLHSVSVVPHKGTSKAAMVGVQGLTTVRPTQKLTGQSGPILGKVTPPSKSALPAQASKSTVSLKAPAPTSKPLTAGKATGVGMPATSPSARKPTTVGNSTTTRQNLGGRGVKAAAASGARGVMSSRTGGISKNSTTDSYRGPQFAVPNGSVPLSQQNPQYPPNPFTQYNPAASETARNWASLLYGLIKAGVSVGPAMGGDVQPLAEELYSLGDNPILQPGLQALQNYENQFFSYLGNLVDEASDNLSDAAVSVLDEFGWNPYTPETNGFWYGSSDDDYSYGTDYGSGDVSLFWYGSSGDDYSYGTDYGSGDVSMNPGYGSSYGPSQSIYYDDNAPRL
jgi:hypothetical protein